MPADVGSTGLVGTRTVQQFAVIIPVHHLQCFGKEAASAESGENRCRLERCGWDAALAQPPGEGAGWNNAMAILGEG